MNEDHELTLMDRLGVIRDVVAKHGEGNFYLSFSGGKDSTILHRLIDMAIPGNRIPRVYFDTGIEYADVRSFVMKLASEDDRFEIVRPTKPIKKMLETYGYPFKSKEHSTKLHEFQMGHGDTASSIKYRTKGGNFACPASLLYQFSEDFTLKVSQHCCHQLKKYPAKRYETKSGRHIVMTGMRKEEGGQRSHMGCIVTAKDGSLKKFHPLAVVSEEWEEWFVQRESIELPRLYYPPFNFKRTGCKGCPYSLDLQAQLDLMAEYLPTERAQCEAIWKPVYDEYRRIGFRLRKGIDDGMVGLLDD